MSLLVAFDIETLAPQIQKARKLQLICVIRRRHEKFSTAIFDDLQSERRKIVELKKRKYGAATFLLIAYF
jgi:hypothetical protein